MTRADWDIAPGDLVMVQLGPVRGTEQDGIRPALVVSAAKMHSFSRRAFICPITRNKDRWPTKVALPDGLVVEGSILCDQLRAIDRRERIVRRLGTATDAVVRDTREKIAALLGIDFQ